MFLFIIVKASELKTSHLQRETERLIVKGNKRERERAREGIILFSDKIEVVLYLAGHVCLCSLPTGPS